MWRRGAWRAGGVRLLFEVESGGGRGGVGSCWGVLLLHGILVVVLLLVMVVVVLLLLLLLLVTLAELGGTLLLKGVR